MGAGHCQPRGCHPDEGTGSAGPAAAPPRGPHRSLSLRRLRSCPAPWPSPPSPHVLADSQPHGATGSLTARSLLCLAYVRRKRWPQSNPRAWGDTVVFLPKHPQDGKDAVVSRHHGRRCTVFPE